MKLRTPSQLDEFLDKDFSWRIKEIGVLMSNIKAAKDPLSKSVALRAGVALLYAHWEGFVKKSAESYLQFVAVKGLAYNQLSPCFVGLAARGKIQEFQETKKASVYTQFIDFVLNGLSGRASIPYDDIITTTGNLSSNVLREILHTIGLDYTPYELKGKLIDSKLVYSRNHIAHGEYIEIGEDDVILLHAEITALMRAIKTEISNAAATGSYQTSSSYGTPQP